MKKRSTFVKILKKSIPILVHLACISLVWFIVAGCIRRYNDFQTRALTNVKPTSDAKEFVAFTICPGYRDSFKVQELEKYNTSVRKYRKGDFMGNKTDGDPLEIFKDVTFDVHELVRVIRVHIRGEVGKNIIYLMCQNEADHCPSDFHLNYGIGRMIIPHGDDWNEQKLANLYKFKEHNHHKFGRCFEIQFRENLIKRGIHRVAIWTNHGRTIYIYLNSPGQFRRIDETSRIISIQGEYQSIDVHYTVEVDSLGKKSYMPCSSEMNKRLDECIYKKTAKILMKLHNCILPFLPHDGLHPICKSANETDVSNYIYLVYDNQRAMCGLPCKRMIVNFGNEMREKSYYPDKSYLNVYFKSTAQYTKIVMDYPFVSMLAGE